MCPGQSEQEKAVPPQSLVPGQGLSEGAGGGLPGS